MPKKLKTIKEMVNDAPKEVADGITIEKLSPMYFDLTKLIHQPAPIYRMDSANHRYYYRIENDEPIFYTSVTTMIRNTLPTSPHLIQWLVGKQGSGEEEAMERASYGSFLHAQCGDLLITGRYDLDKLQEKLILFMAKEKTTIKQGWVDDLKKDILAFAQFMIDTNCKPLAIEIILYHPTDGYAGALDLVCELDIEEKGFFGETYASGVQKGLPKETKQTRRVVAILDVKSGRKGFYESHEIQLQAYLEMWNCHFPDVKIERLYNWSPKDWRTTPSYNLKDQSESKNLVKLKHLVELSKIEDDKKDKKVTIVSGHIDITKGLLSHIEELTFTELVKRANKPYTSHLSHDLLSDGT
jgi:hypothetical protein